MVELTLLAILAYLLMRRGGDGRAHQRADAPADSPPSGGGSVRFIAPPADQAAAISYCAGFAALMKKAGLLDIDVWRPQTQEDRAWEAMGAVVGNVVSALVKGFSGDYVGAVLGYITGSVDLVVKSDTIEKAMQATRKLFIEYATAQKPPPVSFLAFAGARMKPYNVVQWDWELPWFLLQCLAKMKEEGYPLGYWPDSLEKSPRIMGHWNSIKPPSGRAGPPIWYCFHPAILFQREARFSGQSGVFARQLGYELVRRDHSPFEIPKQGWINAFRAQSYAAGVPQQQSLIFEIGHSPFWGSNQVSTSNISDYLARYTIQREDPRWLG